MKNTMQQLLEVCEKIEAGYASGLCLLDDHMVPLAIELSDMTATIRTICIQHQEMTDVLERGLLMTGPSSAHAEWFKAARAALGRPGN